MAVMKKKGGRKPPRKSRLMITIEKNGIDMIRKESTDRRVSFYFPMVLESLRAGSGWFEEPCMAGKYGLTIWIKELSTIFDEEKDPQHIVFMQLYKYATAKYIYFKTVCESLERTFPYAQNSPSEITKAIEAKTADPLDLQTCAILAQARRKCHAYYAVQNCFTRLYNYFNYGGNPLSDGPVPVFRDIITLLGSGEFNGAPFLFTRDIDINVF